MAKSIGCAAQSLPFGEKPETTRLYPSLSGMRQTFGSRSCRSDNALAYRTYSKCTPVRPVTRRVRLPCHDITLTAGIRQNLLSLQNTAANLTTTQEHLATGKKVNTAFDNPTSYFTSQSLTQPRQRSERPARSDRPGPADAQRGQRRPHRPDQPAPTGAVDRATGAADHADRAAATTGSVALTSAQRRAGNLLIDVGASTYTSRSRRARPLSAIEAQINGTTGLGANGAVTATDDGSGHLVLTGNTNTTAFTVSANAKSAALGVTASATSTMPSHRSRPRAPRCRATTTPC